MSVEVTIICDGCSMLGDAGQSARAARSQLRDHCGWRTSLPGGRDLCPECAERETDGDA